jgi:hypothetical protein
VLAVPLNLSGSQLAAGRDDPVTETDCLPNQIYALGMMRAVNTTTVEADLAALKVSAERAGTALACLFASSDEFEAQVIRVRREQGAFASAGRAARWREAVLSALLSFVFLMF